MPLTLSSGPSGADNSPYSSSSKDAEEAERFIGLISWNVISFIFHYSSVHRLYNGIWHSVEWRVADTNVFKKLWTNIVIKNGSFARSSGGIQRGYK